MKFFFIICFLTLTGLSTNAQETNAPTFGKGMFNPMGSDSTWIMKIGTSIQLLAIANWGIGAEGGLVEPEQNFLVRRARFKI